MDCINASIVTVFPYHRFQLVMVNLCETGKQNYIEIAHFIFLFFCNIGCQHFFTQINMLTFPGHCSTNSCLNKKILVLKMAIPVYDSQQNTASVILPTAPSIRSGHHHSLICRTVAQRQCVNCGMTR